jgi:hypothetical protein
MAWADELPEEQRAAMLARTAAPAAADAPRPVDGWLAYLFGAPAAHDGWLRVVLSSSSPSSTTAAASAGGGVGSPSVAAPSPGARAIGAAPQAAGAGRPVPQEQQQQQRVGAGAGPQSPSVRGGAGGSSQQQQTGSALGKSFGPVVAFPLKHWELLPDQGASGGAANDTAISLALVGTRRA